MTFFTRRRAWSASSWTLFLLALAAAPAMLDGGFELELLSKVMIMSIFAASLQLLVGCTGLVSLGHAAFFGVGAYATALVVPQAGAANLVATLAFAGGVAMLCAVVIGLLVLRTRGIYFIMVTLAFAQMLYYVVHDGKGFGGSDGTYLYFKPVVGMFGKTWIDLADGRAFYWSVLAVLVFTLGVLWVVMRSRFGHALAGIRHNEQRMTASAYPVFLYKLASFAIGGALAGIAGSLYAFQYGFVNPELFSWHQSGNVLLMVILGGPGFGGAIAGALVFVLLSDWLSELTKHWQLIFGLLIIVSVAVLPLGLTGGVAACHATIERLCARRRGAPVKAVPKEERAL
jgi:branched-chain amino acid transport system permease protein